MGVGGCGKPKTKTDPSYFLGIDELGNILLDRFLELIVMVSVSIVMIMNRLRRIRCCLGRICYIIHDNITNSPGRICCIRCRCCLLLERRRRRRIQEVLERSLECRLVECLERLVLEFLPLTLREYEFS